mmetsp:Transcript_85531/g.250406  ORF Transcript_85531/g.250406 Transcript_85531/m.250406 type:complete len:249 (-) Transcript_85531:126-872(-)
MALLPEGVEVQDGRDHAAFAACRVEVPRIARASSRKGGEHGVLDLQHAAQPGQRYAQFVHEVIQAILYSLQTLGKWTALDEDVSTPPSSSWGHNTPGVHIYILIAYHLLLPGLQLPRCPPVLHEEVNVIGLYTAQETVYDAPAPGADACSQLRPLQGKQLQVFLNTCCYRLIRASYPHLPSWTLIFFNFQRCQCNSTVCLNAERYWQPQVYSARALIAEAQVQEFGLPGGGLQKLCSRCSQRLGNLEP